MKLRRNLVKFNLDKSVIMIVMTGGLWGYAYLARFTAFFSASLGQKGLLFVVFMLAGILLALGLIAFVLKPIWKAGAAKGVAWVAPLSALLVTAGFIIFQYRLPFFPERHVLELVADGVKNPLAQGARVEIKSVKLLLLPSGPQKLLALFELEQSGEWVLTAEALTTTGEQTAVARYAQTFQGGVEIVFLTSPASGIATIHWNEIEKQVDLYSPQPGSVIIELPSPQNFYQLDWRWKALVGAAVVAEWLALSTLITLLGLLLYARFFLKLPAAAFSILFLIALLLNILLNLHYNFFDPEPISPNIHADTMEAILRAVDRNLD